MFTRLREDIASIIQRDPAARNAWEVLTCYPGLHALIMHRWARWCWLHGLKWLGRYISYCARILTGIEIHPGATIGRRVLIDHGFGVVIGQTAVVGDDCTIYQGVTLGGTSLTKGAKRHPTLERGVIVGAGAQVLGAFTVGEYAKIGSNAVVVKEVPAGATAVGNPAHLTKKDERKADGVAGLFAAYGVTANGDDPLSKALQELISHVAKQDQRMEKMVSIMKASGLCCQEVPDPGELDPEALKRLVD